MKSTDQEPMPGYIFSAKLKTGNSSLPYVTVKGVTGNSQKTMNASIWFSNGSQSESLTNADLTCSYVVQN